MARTRRDVGSAIQTTVENIAAQVTEPPGAGTVLLEVPLASEIEGSVPHFVEVALRSPTARSGLARLRDGMIRAGATSNGRPVESNADAVRALLEMLGSQD